MWFLAGQESAGAVTLHALVWIGGGLAGHFLYLVCLSTYRPARILRQRRRDDEGTPAAG